MPLLPAAATKMCPACRAAVQGVAEGLRKRRVAIAVVGDVGPHLHGVVEAPDGVARRAAAVGAEELQGHDLDVPVDAGDADAVVAHGADRAGDVRAVAVVVQRVAVVVDEVVAVDVIDEAVAVVVDPVAGNLAGLVQMLAARSGWL